MDWAALLSRDARVMRSSLIRQLTGLVNQPDVISFAAGSPNAGTFPHERLREIVNDLVDRQGGQVFQYSVTRGNPRLIAAVRERDRQVRGIETEPGETLIASGSQQGLDFVARVLLDPGDAVFVEKPSYIGAMASFENLRAKLFAVDCDAGGMDLDHLARISSGRRDSRAGRASSFMPSRTSRTLRGPSGPRTGGGDLYEFAVREGLLIFEDDAYGELYFDGVDPASLRPIKALDERGHVIHLSTFSKILAPGLRVAWIHGPEDIVRRIEYCKETGDLCTSTLSQKVILEFLERGWMPGQAALVRRFYRDKSEAMQQVLKRRFGSLATWRKATGGLYQWLRLPEGVDALELFHASIEEDRVAFIPGAPFFADGAGSNTLRLSFSNVKDENIEVGLSLLSRRVRRAST